jgi:hypothetical protein
MQPEEKKGALGRKPPDGTSFAPFPSRASGRMGRGLIRDIAVRKGWGTLGFFRGVGLLRRGGGASKVLAKYIVTR